MTQLLSFGDAYYNQLGVPGFKGRIAWTPQRLVLPNGGREIVAVESGAHFSIAVDGE